MRALARLLIARGLDHGKIYVISDLLVTNIHYSAERLRQSPTSERRLSSGSEKLSLLPPVTPTR